MKIFKCFALFSFLVCVVFTVKAQKIQLTATNVADSIQAMRNTARQLWIKPNATTAQLEESIKLLNAAFAYLAHPDFKDLAQGNFYLAKREGDLSLDLLSAYVRNKQYAEATTILEKMYDLNSPWYSLVAKDTVFAEFRKTPQVASIIDQFKLRAGMVQGKALASKYLANLTEDEKIAGLSLLWMQARYNFIYLDRLNIDWNKTYLDFLPQVRNTKNTAEYYLVLQRFYALLKDGHTNVFLPAELRKEFNSRPPIRTELIEGRVFITAVSSDSLRKAGIVPGLEIIKIDDVAVHAYAEKNIKPYQSSSTTQDLEIREYTYSLLNGADTKPVKLELKNSKNKQWSQLVNRSGYKDIILPPSLRFSVRDDYGYLELNSFADESVIKQFDSLYTTIAKTKGLIIDVRNNGGGDSWIGYHILSTLTNKETPTSTSRILGYTPRFGAEWYTDDQGMIQPNQKRFYQMPVVLLTSARTFSAAEDFTVAFRAMKRGKLIGQATGGSTGQPFSFVLPGGGFARVCSKEDTYPDGTKFVGVGILPDIQLKKTIDDVFSRRDAVLEKAFQVLKIN